MTPKIVEFSNLKKDGIYGYQELAKKTTSLFKNNLKSNHQKARLGEFNLAWFTDHTCEESFSVILAKEVTLQAYYSIFCLYHTLFFVDITLIFVHNTVVFWFKEVFGNSKNLP